MVQPAQLTTKKWFYANVAPITNSYDILPKDIGKGVFGTVYKAKMRTQDVWRAVKKIAKKTVTDKTQFLNEIDIMKKLDHPNIVKLYETFEDDRYVYLVMDLCQGGELFDKICDEGCFTEEQAREYFMQIMLLLNYLHSQEIAHRDIKPENLLFVGKEKNSPLKLIDFGLSIRFNKYKPNTMKTLVGTAYYMAPEVLKGVYDHRCDIWSAGVILYLMVSGIPPFNGETDEDIADKVNKMQYTFDIVSFEDVSQELKKLIASILVGPQKRPTADAILKNHWMINPKPNNQPLKINFNGMKSFSSYNKLKKVAAIIIASQLDSKEIQGLNETFRSIDINNDGVITIEEIRIALEKQKQKPGLQELSSLISNISMDSAGKINYTEFVASCMQQEFVHRSNLIALAFSNIDINRDGKISKEELHRLFESQVYFKMNSEFLDTLIKDCDKNNDGVIDYNEFLDMMLEKND